MSWLREFVDAPTGIDELAEKLTSCGFEVGAVEPWPAAPGAPDGETDAVLDLEITTNRPDCLSVLGIAREVATACDTPLRRPPAAPAETDADAEGAVSVAIDDPALCPRYTGALAEVVVGPSPPWLARRLEAADVRPVNNVVDVTNYVMIELGQPMHAFDRDRLAGPEIRVRRARAGETVRTLDDTDRALAPEMLVIADADRPQAVAGIMGGAASQVGGRTRTIVLEAACFDPLSVRRTSRRLGLATDASYRFERGADVAAPPAAIRRARRLLADIGAGTPRGALVDRFPAPPRPVEIRLRRSRIERVLGQTIDENFVAPALTRLGFEPTPAAESGGAAAWRVRVPTFRVDVGREEDLIEEVARHHGYDRIPTSFPALTQPAAAPGPWRARDRLVRRLLTGGGFCEAVTYGFVDRAAARAVHADRHDVVALRNPLSERGAVLRPSLLPGLVDAVVRNRRRERRDVRLFEIGSRFRRADGETPALGLAVTGAAADGHWSGPARRADLFDLTGAVAQLCAGFGLQAEFEPTTAGHLSPGQSARVHVRTGGGRAVLGEAGRLDPAFAAARGMTGPDPVYVAELDLRPFDPGAVDRLHAAPVPRHPSTTRDISVEVDDALPAARVRDTIRAAAGPALVDLVEVDRYTGKGVAAGAVSLSVRLTFRASDRTLTDAEVQKSTDAVLQALADTHNARQR